MDIKLLETFSNETSHDYLIEHLHEEFTSVCPITGHPDFGEIKVQYVPADHCVELKSLKNYLHNYRDKGCFFETTTNRILEDLNKVLQPKWIRIEGRFKGRGGIKTCIAVEMGKNPLNYSV